jgi:hypothetical protein
MAQFIPSKGDSRAGNDCSQMPAPDSEDEPVAQLARELAERARASRFRLYLERLVDESRG